MNRFFFNIKLLAILCFAGLTGVLNAQDGMYLRDLNVNPTLHNAKKTPSRKSAKPLLLPFSDDFSALKSPYPNANLWQDNVVFVNANYPLFPPTIGVATFDALNENGHIYDTAAAYAFPADNLTSQPIRLDSAFGENGGNPRDLREALYYGDTVFLSFYYQPGGGFGSIFDGNIRGRAPKDNDWLILEFFNPISEEWEERWHAEGASLEEFCPLCAKDTFEIGDSLLGQRGATIPAWKKEFFKYVVVPIADTTFLRNNFQFRFRNMSSLEQDYLTNPSRQSSGGQWHLDNVRLDVHSSKPSVFTSDVAFVERSKNVLKTFQAMPLKQFRGQQDLVPEIPILFRNLDDTTHSINYHIEIVGPSYFWDTTATNPTALPFHESGFNAITDPTIDIYAYLRNFRIPQLAGTFEIRHILKSDETNRDTNNNIMSQLVHFQNFYAYDDGTPEFGLGFLRESENAMSEFAMRFPLNVPDTLIGVQIWFNHTKNAMNKANFNLAVWSAKDENTPEKELYFSDDLLPVYADSIGFQTFWLEQPLLLNAGDFFVGFQQKHNLYMNLGFDQNNHAENRMFTRLDKGAWKPLFYYGSAMIRPLFGTRDWSKICDRNFPPGDAENIHVFPNPSDGIIFIETSETIVNAYEIYDLSGRKLAQKTIHQTQFSTNLPEKSGVYILILHTANGRVSKKVVRR